jgi:cytochrome c5
MPAKGGRPDLSDEAVRAAVDFMLEQSRAAGRESRR